MLNKEFEPTNTKNLELRPYYLDKELVKPRIFGEIHWERIDVDWKNLDKLTKETVANANLTTDRLISLKAVLQNEIARLAKLDTKCEANIQKVDLV